MSTKQIKSEVTIKNTKEQILSAYNEALSKLNSKDSENMQNKQKISEEQNLIRNINSQKDEDVFKQVGDLKTSIIKQLDVLSEKLIFKQNKFDNLQKAIEIEQNHLENLYAIKDSSNALSALLIAQKDEKDKFNNEIEQIKKNWAFEKSKLDNDYKEHRDSIETKRKREEEEYQYRLSTARRKELDDYNAKKLLQEQALQDKENKLAELEGDLKIREKSLNDLEKQVQDIPKRLEETEKKTETNITKILTEKFEHAKQLQQQQYEASSKMHEQSINYLQNQIKSQDQEIKELKTKLASAFEQVQNIANKALETSVKRIFVSDDEKHSKTNVSG